MKRPTRSCDTKDGKWSCIRMKCPFAMQTMRDFGRPDLEVNHSPGRDTFSAIDGKACVCDTIKYFNEFKSLEEIQDNCKPKRK